MDLAREEEAVDPGEPPQALPDIMQIRSAMESLPEPYGLVMDLVLIEGLDYREISRLTGTKEATLRSLYARGRKKLIAALNIKTN